MGELLLLANISNARIHTYLRHNNFPHIKTEEAFGETWGLLVGYLGRFYNWNIFAYYRSWTFHAEYVHHCAVFESDLISGVTTDASYPVLFLSYIHNQYFPNVTDTDRNVYLHYGILAGITVTLVYVCYRGLHVVGKASILLFFVSMAPFVLMVIIGIPIGKFNATICATDIQTLIPDK